MLESPVRQIMSPDQEDQMLSISMVPSSSAINNQEIILIDGYEPNSANKRQGRSFKQSTNHDEENTIFCFADIDYKSPFSDEYDQFNNIQTAQASWHWDIFAEFFFYHLIFYLLLGPFTCVVLAWRPGLILMKNMRFYPSLQDVFFPVQSFIWIGSLVVSYFYFIQENTIVSFTEIGFMWFTLMQKTLVIATKYATLSPEVIEIYKTQILTTEQFSSHLMLDKWRTQTIELIFKETIKSFQRHQQDKSKFVFQFLVQPSEGTIQNLQKMVPEGLNHHIIGNLDLDYSNGSNSFSGDRIVAYLITQFQLHQPVGRMLWIHLFSIIILSITPLLVRFDGLIKNPVSHVDFFLIILNALVTFANLFGSFIFLTLGLIDLKRKYYLLQQCSLMIETNKQLNTQKLVPTINLHDPLTLQAWSQLRSVCFDYGQTYNLRTQGFYSTVFLSSIIIYILYLGLALGVIVLDQLQLILLGELSIIFILNTTIYLVLGAELNSYFDTYDSQLENIKTSYLDTSTAKYLYFPADSDIHNSMNKRCVSHIKKNTQFVEEVEEYKHIVIKALKNCQRILRYDEKNNAFQLYGVIITFNLLKSLLVAFATVVGYTVLQRLNSTH